MPIREHMTIECPPALAFDLMADVRKLPEWNDAASRAEMKTDGPIALGTEFVAINRGQEMTSTITTFDRPGLLEFSVANKALDVDASFHFGAAPSGTELVIEFEPHPKGVMKALFPFLKPLIKRDLRTQHRKFKQFCESQATTSGHLDSATDK